MPYVVLARKYRPRGFSALLGQDPVVRALSNALSQGRLHHAYLFTGTRGVGKTTVSRILAKALNCVGPDGQGGITSTPCGVCMPCTAIDGGHFVDYVELDAASNRGVDDMTQLLDQAVYKPVVGRYKVYMIDEVHMLTTTAFNAMLKTLEEPPDYLKFVLATTDPQKVPATVLSRCLQFSLRPLTPDTVQAHLQQVLQAEQVAAEPGALRLLARAARGSMRDALSITDQAIAYGGGAIAEAGVRAMLGTVDRGQALRLAQALAAGDGPALIALADALHASGQSAGGALDDLAQLFQELAVLQQAPDSCDPLDADAAESLALASAFAADELQLYYSMALHGRADLPLAPDERGGLVMALLRMLAFRPPGAHRPQVPVRAPVETSGGSAVDLARGAAADTAAASPSAARSDVVAGPSLFEGCESAVGGGPSGMVPDTASAPAVAPPEIAAPAVSAALATAAVAQPVASAANSAPAAAPLLRRTEARAVAAVPVSVQPPVEARPPDARPPDARPLDEPRSTIHPGALARAAVEPDVEAGRDLPTPDTVPSIQRDSAADELPADRWDRLVRRLDAAGSIAALARELALQADCHAVTLDGETEVWHLRVDSETLRSPTQRDKLTRAVGHLLERPVRLDATAGQPLDSPAMRLAQARRQRQDDAERQIHEHPMVRTLLARYTTARIVPGSIKPV